MTGAIPKKEFFPYFPYDEIRDPQLKMMSAVESALNSSSDLIVHAPTGIGKTAASLAPVLKYAMENDKVILFLTSRHTQHKIAVETLKLIKEKHKIDFAVSDLIAKRWMCPQDKIDMLGAREFIDYCRKAVQDYVCEFYARTKSKTRKPSPAALHVVDILKKSPCFVEEIIRTCKKDKLCPYEIALLLAKDSRVIIADYYYIFNEDIRKSFLNKIERDMKDIILVIDEGHNLPARIRELLSDKISVYILDRAKKEAKKFGFKEASLFLSYVHDAFNSVGKKLEFIKDKEALVSKEEFKELVINFDRGVFDSSGDGVLDYTEIISVLKLAAEEIREKNRISFTGAVASFLESWDGADEGFLRIIKESDSVSGKTISLFYKCMDPSFGSIGVIGEAHSSLLMSGTLIPTSMYRDLLGFSNVDELVLESPFPKSNRLSLIVPKTTTKFTARNEAQYKSIAEEVSRISELIKGNVAVFFPSYWLRDRIYQNIFDKTSKTLFLEEPSMSKEEKFDMLERFKSYNKSGALLLGVVAANFSEGIDLPGDFLNGVIIVGLPLSKPDLETTEVINYYDKKFGRGWDYGYLFPAFNKTLQAAGRCIRSETDKGVIVFLDERFVWSNYLRCFPLGMNLRISKDYENLIKGFYYSNGDC